MRQIRQRFCSFSAAATAAGILALAAAPAFAGNTQGEIVAVDARTVSVQDADGETTRFEFDPEIDVECPSEPLVTVLDLRQGQAVTVTYDDTHPEAPPSAVRIELDGDTRIDRDERLDRIASELGGD